MATANLLIGTADTDASPNTSGSFAPTSGALLVAFVQASTTVDTGGTLASSVSGFTFTKIDQALYNASAYLCFAFVSDALVSDTSSQTVTFTHGGSDTANGTVIQVYEINGVTRSGLDAVRQSAKEENKGGTTPAPVFASACLTTNVVLGVTANLTNPAGITPPSGWTEDATYGDLGYASPTSGQAVCHINSGCTDTTITWGAASPSGRATIAVEIDTSSASPSITNVDGDNSIYPGQTSITANCANMPATASAKIVSGSNSITMSNYDDTSVNAPTFDAPSLASFLSAGIKFGTVTFEIYN